MKNKSAKDIAFDRERCKYKKQIADLRNIVKKKESEIADTKEQLRVAESKCEELEDWIQRLLEYMDMPEEDMKQVIKTQKSLTNHIEAISKLFDLSTRKFY